MMKYYEVYKICNAFTKHHIFDIADISVIALVAPSNVKMIINECINEGLICKMDDKLYKLTKKGKHYFKR